MLLKDIAVVIGMPRTGTTWLYENLKHHPDVCASDYKEINRYLLDLSDERYMGYFCDCSKKIKLDISPFYFFDKGALINIARNHDKVILLVREEKAWIESLRNQIAKWDKNVAEMEKTKIYLFNVGGRKVVFDYNLYQHDQYLSEIRRIFGDNLLVLDFCLLQREPINVLKNIEAYLGIRSYFTSDTCSLQKINSSEQGMSRLYALLIRTNVLHRVTPIALRVLPKRLIHWLRRRCVYGN